MKQQVRLDFTSDKGTGCELLSAEIATVVRGINPQPTPCVVNLVFKGKG